MKIKHILITFLSGMLLLSSCNNALDVAPDGRLSYDDIFSDNDRVASYLNTIYNNVDQRGLGYAFWTNWFVGGSDEAYDSDAQELPGYPMNRWYIGNASAASHPFTHDKDFWGSYWTAIRRAALFISRIDRATVNEERNRRMWKAEAHILRAYYYSELLKLYGAVLPIEDDPYNYTDDFSQLRPATYYEVVQFIISDCNAALAIDELPWRRTTSAEQARVTKAVAEAIKSQMILYAASPLNNDGRDLWEEAYTITKKSLENVEAAGYELYSTLRIPDVYNGELTYLTPDGYPAQQKAAAAAIYEYFCETMQYGESAADKETIWQDPRGNGNNDVQGIGAQNAYKCGLCPTQELVDAFETLDGQPIYVLDDPYTDQSHLQINPNPANTLYDENDPYMNRDPRFYTTVYYHLSKRYAKWGFATSEYPPDTRRAEIVDLTDGSSNPIGADLNATTPNFRYRSRTGYYQRKFIHPYSDKDNGIQVPPVKRYRLAELILNYAEAAAEAGYTGEALIALNRIRTRAAMPAVSTSSQPELITRIRQERRVELAWEEHRFFDIRRWTQPTGNLVQYSRTTAMKIVDNGDGTYQYNRVSNQVKAQYDNWENKYLWMPIPLAESSRLLAITGVDWQNPGW